MELFYKISDKELLEIRRRIFLEKGIPALAGNGFVQSPFSTSWYGKNNLGDYTYELCRISKKSHLEIITTHISGGDKWIKIFLNIFQLQPVPSSIEELKGTNGLKYSLPPNSLTQMRLRVDDFKGIPLFNFVEHKLKSYNSQRGLNRRIKELGDLIEKDMNSIDSFIENWHELHNPSVTDWEGTPLSSTTE